MDERMDIWVDGWMGGWVSCWNSTKADRAFGSGLSLDQEKVLF